MRSSDPATRPSRRVSPGTVFWTTLVLMFVGIGGWSVANPPMAAPDEPAHAVKAAATVRGEFVADESAWNPGRGDFVVPDLFRQGWSLACVGFEPETPASCAPALTGDLDAPSTATSHVARYNPLYYAIIGVPSLLPASGATFILMRLMSALLNAVLIAFVVRTVAELKRPNLPLLGVVAALTPMAIFIASTMTPQGPEILGAVLVTVVLLALVFEPSDALLRQRLWVLVVGTLFFATARGLSVVYLAIAVIAVVLVAPVWRGVWAVIRDRRAWVPLGACVAIAFGGLAYTLLSGSLALGVVYPDPSLTARDVVVEMFHNTDVYVEQIIGIFGWSETYMPLWVVLLVGGIAFTAGLLGFSQTTCKNRIVLIGLLALCVGLPLAVQLTSFRSSGMVWQGKYVMPLAIMLPVLSGFLAQRRPMGHGVSASIVKTAVGVFVIVQTAAFIVNLHRYINGWSGPWLELIPDAWLPPLPVWLLLATQLIAWVGFAMLIRSGLVDDDSLTPLHPEAATVRFSPSRARARDMSDSSVG